jgi:hypothetical protein
MMEIKEAISFISRFRPCSHDALYTTLGVGNEWCRCEDCGETMKQSSVKKLRAEGEKFVKASDIIVSKMFPATEKPD